MGIKFIETVTGNWNSSMANTDEHLAIGILLQLGFIILSIIIGLTFTREILNFKHRHGYRYFNSEFVSHLPLL